MKCTNSESKFKSGDIDQATNMRETPCYQQFTFDQTNFEKYRFDYHKNANLIRNMRLMEHLGRYTPFELKQAKLQQFKVCLINMTKCLIGMHTESIVYKDSLNRMPRDKPDVRGRTNKDEQYSFKAVARRNIKQVEDVWVQLFQEGSLKRLTEVMSMLNLEDCGIVTHYQIVEWSKNTELNLCAVKLNWKNPGCCCLLF